MRWKEKRRNKKSRCTCRSESDNASKQTGSYLLHCSTASTAQHNAVPQAQHSTQLSTQHSTIQSTRSTKPPSEYVPIRGRQRNQRAISSYSGVPGIIFVCVGLFLVCTRMLSSSIYREHRTAQSSPRKAGKQVCADQNATPQTSRQSWRGPRASISSVVVHLYSSKGFSKRTKKYQSARHTKIYHPSNVALGAGVMREGFACDSNLS